MEIFNSIWGWLETLWNSIVVLLGTIENPVFDILDILIVAFIIYKAFHIMRATRAEQLIKGIIILMLAYFAAQVFHMRALLWLMSLVFEYGIIVLVILFQPEIRSALEKMGRGNISNLRQSLTMQNDTEDTDRLIDCLTSTCETLSHSKTGGLIVITRQTGLSEITGTGTTLDSICSCELLNNIFFPNSPLHDGAVIIHEGRIVAAGCILPLTTKNSSVSSELGTRHRAAIGISEVSDCIALVISEETGYISIATNGVLTRNVGAPKLKEMLSDLLIGENLKNQKSKNFLSFLLTKLGGKKNEK